MLFQAFIIGFITNGGGGTLTSLYQSGCSQTRYWSFTKFLSRGKWDADAVAALMMKLLQQAKEIWVYVYDEMRCSIKYRRYRRYENGVDPRNMEIVLIFADYGIA